MPHASTSTHSTAPLSADRAFVVHFTATGGRRRRYRGRIEHLASGRSAPFSSLARLLGFVDAILSPPEHEGSPR